MPKQLLFIAEDIIEMDPETWRQLDEPARAQFVRDSKTFLYHCPDRRAGSYTPAERINQENKRR